MAYCFDCKFDVTTCNICYDSSGPYYLNTFTNQCLSVSTPIPNCIFYNTTTSCLQC